MVRGLRLDAIKRVRRFHFYGFYERSVATMDHALALNGKK